MLLVDEKPSELLSEGMLGKKLLNPLFDSRNDDSFNVGKTDVCGAGADPPATTTGPAVLRPVNGRPTIATAAQTYARMTCPPLRENRSERIGWNRSGHDSVGRFSVKTSFAKKPPLPLLFCGQPL